MSEAGQLRVGLIGFGKMGRHHLTSIMAAGLGKVVGVADPLVDSDAVADCADPPPRLFDTAARMLEETRPDVVHIVTPPSTHADLALLALESGAHVYVEKPFTPGVKEAERVLQVAEEKGLLVCAGHQVLFEKAAVKAAGAARILGSKVHVHSYFSFRQSRRNLTPLEQAVDILPHAVYPLLAFLEENSSGPGVELRSLNVTAEGEVQAIVRRGSASGVLVVALAGRPVRHTLEVVGTNGALKADFVSGAVTRLPGPGASAIAAVLAPYITSMQTVIGSTLGFASMFRNMKIAYKGLPPLFGAFYSSILESKPSPVSPEAILGTVALCESVESALREVERDCEEQARIRLEEGERQQAPTPAQTVLVTGATGFLGQALVRELLQSGLGVRALCRRVPAYSRRVAGVQYVACDLAVAVNPEHMKGVETVLHCAAETAGGVTEHQKNSIDATGNLLKAAAAAGIRRFVQVSSIAVAVSSKQYGRPVDEQAPVLENSAERGPYVWGKLESEKLAVQLGDSLGVEVRIVRPGPLVDFDAFSPPGRLGRDLGPRFVAVGMPSHRLAVCGVSTAATVLRYYVEKFDTAPPVLNLLEPQVPTRRELIEALRKIRPDLKVWWLPSIFLRVSSPFLKLLQRVLLGSKKPLDVYAAFASERYDTKLSASLVREASAVRQSAKNSI